MYVCSSRANPPPHEGDVSKPRKLSEPREPQTQEQAVWDLRGHRVLCAQDESRGRVPAEECCAEGVRAGGAALRLKAINQPQPAGISASGKRNWLPKNGYPIFGGTLGAQAK